MFATLSRMLLSRPPSSSSASSLHSGLQLHRLAVLAASTWTKEDVSKALNLTQQTNGAFAVYRKDCFKNEWNDSSELKTPRDLVNFSRQLAARWRDMPDSQRQKYVLQILEQKDWARKVLSEADPRVVAEFHHDKAVKRMALLRFRLNKLARDLERPARPLSGYQHFFKDSIPEHRQEKNKYSIIGKLWTESPDSVKEEYNARGRESQEQYLADMEVWRAKVTASEKWAESAEKLRQAQLAVKVTKRRLKQLDKIESP